MKTTNIARRLRGHKLHAWVNSDLLEQFEKQRITRGLSRDGALEIAITEYLKKAQAPQ